MYRVLLITAATLLVGCGPSTATILEGPAPSTSTAEQEVVIKFPKGRLYVGGRDGDVTVVELTNNTIERTIHLPGSTIQVAASPDRTRVYASSRSAQRVLSIEGARVRTRQYGGNFEPGGLAVSPSGAVLMVGGPVFDAVSTSAFDEPVELAAASVSPSVLVWPSTDGGATLFAFPQFMPAGPDDAPEIGFRRYLPFVNTSWQTISYPYVPRPTDPQGHGFFDATFQPSTDFVLGVDAQVDRVQAFQAGTASYVGAIPTRDFPVGIGVQPRTAYVYVTTLRPERLQIFTVSSSVFEPLLVSLVAELPMDCDYPVGVAFSEFEARAFVGCENKLVEVNTATRTITRTISLPKGAHQMVWMP